MPAGTFTQYETLLLNANVQAFLLLIRNGEGTIPPRGGYNTLFGGGTFNSFDVHPNILINKNGYKSTAAGAYQFLYRTWTQIKNELGLSDFTPHSQDIAAVRKLQTRGALQDIKDGKITSAIQKTNKEWASLPGAPYGQPTQKLSKALAFYKSNGGTLSPNDSVAALNVPSTSKSQNIEGNNEVDSAQVQANKNANFDFEQIQNNIDISEADNVFGTPWGSRFNLKEESNFIGLKQYLLYLTTRFYPQNLIPFVELIPVYTVDKAEPAITGQKNLKKVLDFTARITGNSDSNTDGDQSISTIVDNNTKFEDNSTLLDQERFDKTAQKLSDLGEQGFTDLFTLDPFKETTDAFNTPNDVGKEIQKKRGFGYKIFGNLTFNPAIQGNETSKAGAIGLKSIEIELGAQAHYGMSLVTVKFVDVQGNKFLDINSPWSFILNRRLGTKGGDFYMRYGWQLTIPDPKRENDEQGKRYWSHPGWAAFGALQVGANDNASDEGDTIKRYVQDIASKSQGVITLTQATTESSMKTPGYMIDQQTGDFVLDRKLNPFDYETLTLINPELNVDSQTGSVEATLYFRTNCGVANCLALLNGLNIPPNNFKTKALAIKGHANLSELMTAFVQDNKTYIENSPTLNGIKKSPTNAKSAFLADPEYNIKDWLTVVGGAGTDSLIDADPTSIDIKFDNDDLKMMNTANSNDTRLLLQWVTQVLGKNNCTMIVAAGEGGKTDSSATTVSTVPGGFIIAYDSDKAGENKDVKTSNDLSKRDATFSDYRKYIDSNNTENFIGKRLVVQDDVFSFRFQGSLIESLSIEKAQNTTQTVLDSLKSFAESQGESTEVKEGGENDAVQEKPEQNVTYANKKRQLNRLYSQMAGLKVEAICHPWLRLCRPVFVKGMGFYDGKYMVTKIVHKLNDDNKFVSTINGCRVLVNGAHEQKQTNLENSQKVAMDKPGVGKSSAIGLSPTNPLRNVLKTPTAAVSTLDSFGGGGFGGGGATGNYGTPIVPLRIGLETWIKQLHYSAQDVFRNFLREFEQDNPQYRILITSGYRSFAEQVILKAQNNSNASPGKSLHNYGLAIDLNIQNGSGTVIASKHSSDSTWYNTGIVTLANKKGITWGGTAFGTYKDRVHFGLDGKIDMDTVLAIAKRQFGNNLSLIIGNKVDFTGKTVG